MPAFAPWLRPLLPLDFAEGVEDVVDVGFVLAVVLVLAVDEVSVFRVQVTGLALLSMSTLKVPLRAYGGPKPTAGWRESSKWQLNGSSA